MVSVERLHVESLHPFRDGSMQRPPLAGQQIGRHRLLRQRGR
jgi:hypothetical protein